METQEIQGWAEPAVEIQCWVELLKWKIQG